MIVCYNVGHEKCRNFVNLAKIPKCYWKLFPLYLRLIFCISVIIYPRNCYRKKSLKLIPPHQYPKLRADTGCKSNKRNTKATQTLEAGKGKDIVPGVFPIHHESVRDNGHSASPEDGVDSGRRTTRSLGGLPGLSSSFLKCGEIPSRARWGQFDVRRYLLRVSLLFLQEIK